MTDHKKKRHPAQEASDAPERVSEQETMKTNEETAPQATSEMDLAALLAELEAARKEARENQEGWQRERADFINYKKRIERDQVQISQNISGNILKKFLMVLDDMERALKNRPEGAELQSWWEGVDLIYRKLQNILEAEGVKRIPAENSEFDPNLHEAISHEDHPAVASGHVIEVVQQGYTIGERVLRPALVRVAR